MYISMNYPLYKVARQYNQGLIGVSNLVYPVPLSLSVSLPAVNGDVYPVGPFQLIVGSHHGTQLLRRLYTKYIFLYY